MIINRLKTIIFLTLGFLFFPGLALAASALDRLKNVASQAYKTDIDPEAEATVLLGSIIKAFLSFLGAIFIILIVYAGYNWMTASGDEQKVEKAKSTIKNAIIGLILITGSYAIWWFIAEALI